MFEHRSKPLLSFPAFMKRMGYSAAIALGLTTASLAVGIAGYRYFESMSFIDAFLNTSMLLGGMGEVTDLKTTGGKLFASFYSLYSGFFMMLCSGLLLVPIFHRILHHFHAE